MILPNGSQLVDLAIGFFAGLYAVLQGFGLMQPLEFKSPNHRLKFLSKKPFLKFIGITLILITIFRFVLMQMA